MKILIVTRPDNNNKSRIESFLGKGNSISFYETSCLYDVCGIAGGIKKIYPQILVSAGGDGLLNDTLNALMASGMNVPVGIIPLGSMNLFAVEAGIPLSLPEACKTINDGRTAGVDIGRLSAQGFSRFFICWASSGFDSHVAKLVKDSRMKPVLGAFPSYLINGIRGLFTFKPCGMLISAGGSNYEGNNMVMSNAGVFATKKSRISGWR